MIRYFACLLIVMMGLSSQAQELELKEGDNIPELKLFHEDGTAISIEEIEAEYTLLLFWHYKCSHCQNALTKIDKFLEESKPEGLKILSIYPFGEDVEKFWSYVKDPLNLLTDSVFIHATDPKAVTRRTFSQKAGQPPLLILVNNKTSKIVAMKIKAAELKSVWKELH